MTATYDYLFFSLERGAAARDAFLGQIRAARGELAAAGGEVLGVFFPQLGWEAAEAALVLRWREARSPAARAGLLAIAPVKSARAEPMTPTLRPADDAALWPGGIYVHRRFETAAVDLATFIALSQDGWADFEPRFDARVFALFLMDETQDDRAAGSRRLLLLTRYGDHGVWQASRDPSTAAMGLFARRAQITRETRAASTLLTLI
jgi:hypothetical protein